MDDSDILDTSCVPTMIGERIKAKGQNRAQREPLKFSPFPFPITPSLALYTLCFSYPPFFQLFPLLLPLTRASCCKAAYPLLVTLHGTEWHVVL